MKISKDNYVPFGRYKNPRILDSENLLAINKYLHKCEVAIKHSGYQFVLNEAQDGDFVYFDPPYAPMTKTANFAAYVKGGFGLHDQEELSQTFARLNAKGVKVMLSNSNTPIIHDLYKGFNIKIITLHVQLIAKVVIVARKPMKF